MSVEQQPQADEVIETNSWSSPTEHFRTRHKFKSWALGGSFVPWFTPLYFGALHFSQRNRNLFLVENHLNYRPYWGRRNDEDSKY